MKIKHSVFAICFSVIAVSTSAQEIKFDSEEYDFGTVKPGDTVSYSFNFTNSGKQSLILQDVMSTCACVTTSWSKEPVKKDEKSSIKVIFDTKNKLGMQMKTIIVYSNAPMTFSKILFIKGNIEANGNAVLTSSKTEEKPATLPDSAKKKPVAEPLRNVKDVFTWSEFDRTKWELYGKYNESEYAPRKAEDVITDVDQYLANALTGAKKPGQITDYDLIKKYRNNIDSAFQRLGLIGSDQLGAFFYDKGTSTPVKFGLYGDTALSIIVTGTFIDNIYNTLKLTSRQRATKVITQYILSEIKDIGKNFQGKEIKYIGMTCLYGSKDFADDSPLSTKAEFVAFIAPAKLVRKYIAGDVTEDELVNAADIFVADRDMVAEMKKIKITLE